MAVEDMPAQIEQRRAWSERDWDRLLNIIVNAKPAVFKTPVAGGEAGAKSRDQQVVPVIGPDLMMVEVGAADVAPWNEPAEATAKVADGAAKKKRAPGWMRLESYLTLRLAEVWQEEQGEPEIKPSDLPAEPRFNDFVGLYLDRRGDRQKAPYLYQYVTDIYSKTTLCSAPDVPLGPHTVRLSPAIRQLAKITDFKLFLTTTGDGLLEHALEEERPEEQICRPSPAFSNEEPLDLSPNAVSRKETAVYHLFGAYEQHDHSFVMSEEDLLNYVVALQTREKSLPCLYHVLRNHRLLILGGGFHDWMVRFFLRTAKSELAHCEDVLAESTALDYESLRLFLQRFSPRSEVIAGGGEKFVDELYTRWAQRRAAMAVAAAGKAPATPVVPPPAPVMPERSVFISYASENRAQARALRERLGALGVEAWFDVEQLEAGDYWDQKIRLNVERCTVFIPLVSTATERRPDAYFRMEWNAAAKRTERKAQGQPFLFPLVVEAALRSSTVQLVPPEFKVAQWTHCEGDGPAAIPQGFLDKVVEAHRWWLAFTKPA